MADPSCVTSANLGVEQNIPGEAERISAAVPTLSAEQCFFDVDAILAAHRDLRAQQASTKEPPPRAHTQPGWMRAPAAPAEATAQKSVPHHDHLQYHFFNNEFFLSIRVFGAYSMTQAWSWVLLKDAASGEWRREMLLEVKDFKDGERPAGEMQDGTILQDPSGAAHLAIVASDEKFAAKDGSDAAAVKRKGALKFAAIEGPNEEEDYIYLNGSVLRILPGYQAKQWAVADNVGGSSNEVIHRYDLKANIYLKGLGKTFYNVLGYSKRYFGPYPRFWGYHFMVTNQPKLTIGTADARFGDAKYNYFKVIEKKQVDGEADSLDSRDTAEVPFGGAITDLGDLKLRDRQAKYMETFPMREMRRESCYHQHSWGYGRGPGSYVLGSSEEEVRVTMHTDLEGAEFRKYGECITIIKSNSMESKMTENFLDYEFTDGATVHPVTGFYERCFGTLG